MRTVRKVNGVYRCVVCGDSSPEQDNPHRGKCSCYSDNTQRERVQEAAAGPGTELKKLLKRFGIEPTPTCKCRAKAREMDAWGPDECERPERIEEVLGVMREEAKARGLPFLAAAGRMLIRRAIRNARRAAS